MREKFAMTTIRVMKLDQLPRKPGESHIPMATRELVREPWLLMLAIAIDGTPWNIMEGSGHM